MRRARARRGREERRGDAEVRRCGGAEELPACSSAIGAPGRKSYASKAALPCASAIAGSGAAGASSTLGRRALLQQTVSHLPSAAGRNQHGVKKVAQRAGMRRGAGPPRGAAGSLR